MGKSTISIAIFNYYVSSPEGNRKIEINILPDGEGRYPQEWYPEISKYHLVMTHIAMERSTNFNR